LPVLLLVPFLSLYLFYSLEELFSQALLQQFTFQARLLLDLFQQQAELIEDSLAAQHLHQTDISLEQVIQASVANFEPHDVGRLATCRFCSRAVGHVPVTVLINHR